MRSPGQVERARAMHREIDMPKPPLIFTFYIAAPIEKVWSGFVSKEANQTIFMGADFHVDLEPGGAMTWSGPGKDGRPTRYVTGEVLRAEPPTLLEYKFGMGDGAVMSRVKVALTQETEAVKVVVTTMALLTRIPRMFRMRRAGRASFHA